MKELVWKLHSRLFIWAECVTVSGCLIKPTQTFQTHAPLSRHQESFFHQWRFCGNVVSAACITFQNVLLLLLHHTAETQPVKMHLRNSAEPPRMLLEAAAVPQEQEIRTCSYKGSICGLDQLTKQQRVCRATVGASAVARHFRAALLMQPCFLCCGLTASPPLLQHLSPSLLPSSVPPEKNQL